MLLKTVSNYFVLKITHAKCCHCHQHAFEDMLRGDISWPPHSPDHTPNDFLPWEYLKPNVYTHS